METSEQKKGAASAPVLEEAKFAEFRRKVRGAEVLSGSVERLLKELRFSGRLTVVVKNGSVMKSGYEEGMFVIGSM